MVHSVHYSISNVKSSAITSKLRYSFWVPTASDPPLARELVFQVRFNNETCPAAARISVKTQIQRDIGTNGKARKVGRPRECQKNISSKCSVHLPRTMEAPKAQTMVMEVKGKSFILQLSSGIGVRLPHPGALL